MSDEETPKEEYKEETQTEQAAATETSSDPEAQEEDVTKDNPPPKQRCKRNWKTGVLFAICFVMVVMVAGMGYLWYQQSQLEPSDGGQNILPEECEALNGAVYNGYCYVNNVTQTWSNANNICRNGAGNLVSILSEEENKFVGRVAQFAEDGTLWIGLRREGAPNYYKYKWADTGLEVKGSVYESYANGEPSEPVSAAGQTRCGYLKMPGTGDIPEWFMTDCDSSRNYMCKYALAAPPSPPRDFAATSGPGQLDVSWKAPQTTGGRAVSSYVVTAVPDAALYPLLEPTVVEFKVADSPANYNCSGEDVCMGVVPDLRPKTVYSQLIIAAVNDVGPGIQATFDGPVTVGDRVPDAPVVFSIPGNGMCAITVSKYPPAYDGGQPVTSLTVGSTTYTGDQLELSFYVVNPLPNGQESTINVKVTNSIGDSPVTSVVCSPSTTYPVRPIVNSTLTGFRSVQVQFSGAAAGDSVTAYAFPICEATTTPLPTTTTTLAPNATANITNTTNDFTTTPAPVLCPPERMSDAQQAQSGTLSITNLTTFQRYAIYIQSSKFVSEVEEYRSVPAFDGGDELSSFATPLPRPPDSVRDLSVDVYGIDLTATWTYPESDGDSPLTYFEVTAVELLNQTQIDNNETGNTTVVFVDAVPGAATGFASIEDLEPRTPYNVSVVVYHEYMNQSSEAVTFGPVETELDSPAPPLELMATPLGRAASLTFKPPHDFGAGRDAAIGGLNPDIAAYIIYSSPLVINGTRKSAADLGCACTNGETPQSCSDSKTCTVSMSDLMLGVGSEDMEFVFFVVSETDLGSQRSAPSNPSKPVTILPVLPQDAPTVVSAQPGRKSLNFTLSPPADDGGRPVVEYLVKDPSSDEVVAKSLGGSSWILIADLPGAVPINYHFAAETLVGRSPWTAAMQYTPGAAPPTEPLDVILEPSDGQVRIRFSAPFDDGGSPILSYTAFSVSPELSQTVNVDDFESEALSITFKGLENGKTFKFQVYATNAIGDGNPSSLSEAVETGRQLTVKEWVAGVAAALLFLCIIIAIVYTIWWAWVEKELCWDDGDPNTRENARKRKEQEALALKEAEATKSDDADVEAAAASTDYAASSGEETPAAAAEETPAAAAEETPAATDYTAAAAAEDAGTAEATS